MNAWHGWILFFVGLIFIAVAIMCAIQVIEFKAIVDGVNALSAFGK